MNFVFRQHGHGTGVYVVRLNGRALGTVTKRRKTNPVRIEWGIVGEAPDYSTRLLAASALAKRVRVS